MTGFSLADILMLALLGLIPAALANSRGRSFFIWWVYGSLLFIVALIHAFVVVVKKESNQEKAP